jgi:hypothetical protein
VLELQLDPLDGRVHHLRGVDDAEQMHVRAPEQRKLVRPVVGDVAPAIPHPPQQFIAVDPLVPDELAQAGAQRLAEELVGVQRHDPLAAKLFEGEHRRRLRVPHELSHEDATAEALGDLERGVLALAVVDEHDLIDDPHETLQAALDDSLLVAHHKARGDGRRRSRRGLGVRHADQGRSSSRSTCGRPPPGPPPRPDDMPAIRRA